MARYSVPSVAGQQIIPVLIEGSDASGNQGTRALTLSLRWMDVAAGTLGSADGGVVAVNVPPAATGPGRLAVLVRIGAEEALPRDENRPVYFFDLAAGSVFEPVSLNLFAGADAQTGTGLLRWDERRLEWEELDTIVDNQSGWLSTSVTRPGRYRVGTVGENVRRQSQKLTNFPNPFVTARNGATQIDYELLAPGPVQLQVVNVLGQTVRMLVDEPFQEVGVWNVLWDGRDERGQRVASGVYYCRLIERSARELLPVVLVR